MHYTHASALEDPTINKPKRSGRNARRKAKHSEAQNSVLDSTGGHAHYTVPFLSQAKPACQSPSNDVSRAAGELIWSSEVGKKEPVACVVPEMASSNVYIAHGAECISGSSTLKAQAPSAATQGRNHSDYLFLPSTDIPEASSSLAPSPPGCFLSTGQSQPLVTLHRRMLPYPIDKRYRYSYNPISIHNALRLPPLNQAIRPLAVGPLETAMSYDADWSPGRGIVPSSSQASLSKKQPLEKYDDQTRSIRKPTLYKSPASDPLKNGHITGQACRKAKPLPAPIPTAQYLSVASALPRLAPSPQHLLLVLDLNGTLVYRHKTGSTKYLPRPSLQLFLEYCFANHFVLVWSSATPLNVTGLCSQIFSDVQRQRLLGEWGRDTLDLTRGQYHAKTQVYKRLDRVWDGFALRHSHPNAGSGEHWSQANTLLLDDSVTKAQAQPFNLVEVPEFTRQRRHSQKEKDQEVLGQVVTYLEQARAYENVSAFVRENKFIIDTYPPWHWQRHP